jgi:hypothetical protein
MPSSRGSWGQNLNVRVVCPGQTAVYGLGEPMVEEGVEVKAAVGDDDGKSTASLYIVEREKKKAGT